VYAPDARGETIFGFVLGFELWTSMAGSGSVVDTDELADVDSRGAIAGETLADRAVDEEDTITADGFVDERWVGTAGTLKTCSDGTGPAIDPSKEAGVSCEDNIRFLVSG
jgi:hypothetical protein